MKKFKLPYFLDRFLTRKFSMLSAELKYIISDTSTGKILKVTKQIAHSVNGNFMSNIYMQMHNYQSANPTFGYTAPLSNNSSLKGIAGAYAGKPLGTYMRSEGTVNLDYTGIIIGNGAPVISPTTANLTSQIMHGTGVNQMLYGQQSSPEGVVFNGNETSFRFLRGFVNSSLASITVSEVGMVQSSAGTYLIFIDPVSPGQVVNDGQTLTIEITYLVVT